MALLHSEDTPYPRHLPFPTCHPCRYLPLGSLHPWNSLEPSWSGIHPNERMSSVTGVPGPLDLPVAQGLKQSRSSSDRQVVLLIYHPPCYFSELFDSLSFQSCACADDFSTNVVQPYNPQSIHQQSASIKSPLHAAFLIEHPGEGKISLDPNSSLLWFNYATKTVVDRTGKAQWKCVWSEFNDICYYWGEKQLVKRHIEGTHLKIK
jgi:hypothetical protein